MQMQKKIIVVAIAAAFSAPAFADTTIYGVLDVGYARTKQTTTPAVGGETSNELDAFGFSTFTSSRLGFTNTEDLSDGMKIMSKIETGIGGNVMGYYTQGSTSNGTTIDGTSLGSRELNTSLMIDNTTVKLGFGSTAIRDISLGYAPDPGGNLIGNLLNNDKRLSGNRQVGATVVQDFGSGFKAQVQVTDKTQKVTNADDLKTGNGFLVGGQYADGPISVSLAYQHLDTTQNNTSGTQTNDVTSKIAIIGASYDFGVAKLIGEASTIKADDSVSSANAKATYESIGAQMPLADNKLLAFLQFSHGSYNLGNSGNPDQTMTGFSLGGKYNLSKASYGYASVGQDKLNQTGNVSGWKVQQFAVGLVHTW